MGGMFHHEVHRFTMGVLLHVVSLVCGRKVLVLRAGRWNPLRIGEKKLNSFTTEPVETA